MAQQIEFEIGDPHRVWLARWTAPKQRPDPGQQLGKREWFHEVVIPTQLQALYPVLDRVPRGNRPQARYPNRLPTTRSDGLSRWSAGTRASPGSVCHQASSGQNSLNLIERYLIVRPIVQLRRPRAFMVGDLGGALDGSAGA